MKGINMKKYNILRQLQNNYVFAVVRGYDAQDAKNISESVFKGGIKNIEVTFTTPNAEKVIQSLVKENKDTDMLVGAGTVMDVPTARIAVLNGAQFIVSPHFDKNIAEICNLHSIPYLPGCATVTEVSQALKAGVDVVKVFPGGLLGPKFIKDIHGPIPHVEMMPSGGVSVDNVDEWIKAGAWAVGVGSGLTNNTNTQEDIVENAALFIKKVNGIRGE